MGLTDSANEPPIAPLPDTALRQMTYVPAISLDPHPFARGGSVAIFATSILHVFQAILILWSPVAANATNTAALFYVFATFGLGLPCMMFFMVATAMLATAGALFRLGWVRLALFIPQHFFLGIMSLGGIAAAIQGKYLDGTVIAWEHILTDQLPILALFVVHSSAIIRRAADPNG